MSKALAFVAVVLVLAGCEGERVGQGAADATVDDAASDGAIADTANDAAEDTHDAAVDAGCAPIAGNLVTDGDFSTGTAAWTPENCSFELVAGRCGKALRIYDCTSYGRLRHYYVVPFPAQTKLRLRAWFKRGVTAGSGTSPAAFVRSYGLADGGPAPYDDYLARGNLTTHWTLAEQVFTLTNEQQSFEIYLASMAGGSTPDEFVVSDVSLVVEP